MKNVQVEWMSISHRCLWWWYVDEWRWMCAPVKGCISQLLSKPRLKKVKKSKKDENVQVDKMSWWSSELKRSKFSDGETTNHMIWCGCQKWIKQPHQVMWLPMVSRLEPGTAQVKTSIHTVGCGYQKWSKQPHRVMWLPKSFENQ